MKNSLTGFIQTPKMYSTVLFFKAKGIFFTTNTQPLLIRESKPIQTCHLHNPQTLLKFSNFSNVLEKFLAQGSFQGHTWHKLPGYLASFSLELSSAFPALSSSWCSPGVWCYQSALVSSSNSDQSFLRGGSQTFLYGFLDISQGRQYAVIPFQVTARETAGTKFHELDDLNKEIFIFTVLDASSL